jgi:phage-related protein
MADEAKRVPAQFFETPQGNEPVREWLKDLEPEARRKIGFDLKELEFGWPVGMPLCRSLGRGLWELRSSLPDGRIARVIFCLHRAELVLLHGFINKTQKTSTAGDRACPETDERAGTMTEIEKGSAGSTLDAFLAEEVILEEATEHAIKGLLAWQIDQEMKAQKLTKAAMARRMQTSRAQLDRLLDPENSSVTLHTLHRAATILGRRLRVELL